MRFRKKPVVIEAHQYTRDVLKAEAVAKWSGGIQTSDGLVIETLEGDHLASYGDWVIQGVKGEFYPCKPDIFAATYESADACEEDSGPAPADPWAVLERMQGNIAAEIRVMLGEAPLAQSLFDESQRQRRIEAMKKCAAESTSDADRHESWMKMHLESGWVYGETFDPAAKTHPNLKPWDELPPTTRSKARIFDIVSKAAAELAGT